MCYSILPRYTPLSYSKVCFYSIDTISELQVTLDVGFKHPYLAALRALAFSSRPWEVLLRSNHIAPVLKDDTKMSKFVSSITDLLKSYEHTFPLEMIL